GSAGGIRSVVRLHCSRPVGGPPHLDQNRRHVPWPHRRARAGGRRLSEAEAPLLEGLAGGGAESRSNNACAAAGETSRGRPVAAQQAVGMRVSNPLPDREVVVRRRRPAARLARRPGGSLSLQRLTWIRIREHLNCRRCGFGSSRSKLPPPSA